MEFDTLIKKRKSVREFKKKKPSWKLILEAIDSANQNPFAGNKNNIKYIIIEDLQTIKKIAKLTEQVWITGSNILIVVCSDDSYLENLYGERGRIYSRQQAGAVVQTMLFKLVDLGISACWVGAYHDETMKQHLNIPQHYQIEAIIPVGYEEPKKFTHKPKKQRLEEKIFWEKWSASKRPTIFKEPKDDKAIK